MSNEQSENVIKNIIGDKTKRACKHCGQVHTYSPFTDCYSEKVDGPLPDDLQGYYNERFGDEGEEEE